MKAAVASIPMEDTKAVELRDLQQLAQRRGGRLVSKVYVNIKTPLTWECANGHTWETASDCVKNAGTWCPSCRTFAGEELVRATLVEAFPGKAFDRTKRVPWMEGLELDGYNEELRLAFEYQGAQHREFTPKFHRSWADFESQLERDALTLQRCEKSEVTLLVIADTLRLKTLRSHVRGLLRALGYVISPEEGLLPDLEFYDGVLATSSTQQIQLRRLQTLMKDAGGECLSANYIRNDVPMLFRCEAGHEFEEKPMVMFSRKTVCAECNPTHNQLYPEYAALPAPPGNQPACSSEEPEPSSPKAVAVPLLVRPDDPETQKLYDLVTSRKGFQFVSATYERSETIRDWHITAICPKGHLLTVLQGNFVKASKTATGGCKQCFAEVSGGSNRCDRAKWSDANGLHLDEGEEYKNQSTKYRWVCRAEGHKTYASFNTLKQREVKCIPCKLAMIAKAEDLTLETPWADNYGPMTKLMWTCNQCKAPINISLISLARKLQVCCVKK